MKVFCVCNITEKRGKNLDPGQQSLITSGYIFHSQRNEGRDKERDVGSGVEWPCWSQLTAWYGVELEISLSQGRETSNSNSRQHRLSSACAGVQLRIINILIQVQSITQCNTDIIILYYYRN